MGVRGCCAIKCRKEGVGCNLKWHFCKSLMRRRAGGKTKRRTFLPARPRMRDFEFSLAILHPTPLRKGMRDTKMARWQLKMQFFANPSCVRRKKTFAQKKFPAYARESLKFHLTPYTLKEGKEGYEDGKMAT